MCPQYPSVGMNWCELMTGASPVSVTVLQWVVVFGADEPSAVWNF